MFTPYEKTEDYLKLPATLWSDMDYIAYDVLKIIENTGYKIKTSLENICTMVGLLMENSGYSLTEVYEYIEESGGLEEFDCTY